MTDANENLIDRLARFGAQRADRRRAGWLTAALVAAVAGPAAADAHGRHRKKRGDGTGGVPQPSTGRFCGGIAGIPCPSGYVCVDNPRDGCDPAHGGADCGGICVRKPNPCARIRCASGTVCCRRCGGICLPADVPCGSVMCDPLPCGTTTCQPGEYCCSRTCSQCAPFGSLCRDDNCDPGGTPCGNTVCGKGQFCCNPSCSECAPIDGACTDRYCPPQGEPCGSRVCPDGQVCCNASCGICTAPGGACPAIACLPEK